MCVCVCILSSAVVSVPLRPSVFACVREIFERVCVCVFACVRERLERERERERESVCERE